MKRLLLMAGCALGFWSSAVYAQPTTTPTPSYKILLMKTVSAAEKDTFDELLTQVRSPEAQSPEAMLRLLTVEGALKPMGPNRCTAPAVRKRSASRFSGR